MHKDPDYAKLFRGRPLRFILPIGGDNGGELSQETSSIEIPIDYKSSLISEEEKIGDSYSSSFNDSDDKKIASARWLSDGNIFVTPESLCDLGCETPRVNEKSCHGKEYRYFYAISSDVDLDNPGTVRIYV